MQSCNKPMFMNVKTITATQMFFSCFNKNLCITTILNDILYIHKVIMWAISFSSINVLRCTQQTVLLNSGHNLINFRFLSTLTIPNVCLQPTFSVRRCFTNWSPAVNTRQYFVSFTLLALIQHTQLDVFALLISFVGLTTLLRTSRKTTLHFFTK